MKAICGLMIHTAHRSSMLNQLSNFAPLCRFRRCALCHLRTAEFRNSMSRRPHLWTLTLATLASHHPRISWFVSCQPKGRSNFCSVVRLQWFTLITKSSTKTDWLDLSVYFQHTIKERARFIHINEDPRVVELVVFVFCIFHHSHLMSSQQHCLSSKFCSCSKARPNKPMLRPAQRAIPSSNPDLPMIRSTKHSPGPLAWETNKPKLQSPQMCP